VGPSDLETVLITDELKTRPCRQPQLEAENFGLRELIRELAHAPKTLFQKLVNEALVLCGADSAGLSLVEEGVTAIDARFRWVAVTGELAGCLNQTLPRFFSPCGVVVERRSPQLMKQPVRHYPYIEQLGIPVEEVLLVPFFQGDKAIGTVWIVSHSPAKKFDAEHVRVMESLARFASAAAESMGHVEKIKSSRDALLIREAELRLIEEQLIRAVSVAKIGFYDWDIQSNVVSFSNQMQKDWGVRAGSSLEEVMTYIHEDDRVRVSSLIQSAIKDGIPYVAQYRVIRPADKEMRWVEAKGEISRDAGGRPARFFGTAIDITLRKEAELALAEERHKLKTIFQASPAPMTLWRGKEMVFELVNPAYQEIFRNRPLEGLPLESALPEMTDQPFPEILRQVFETGVPYVGIEEMALIKKTPDGKAEERFYDFTYARVNDADGKPYGVYDHAVDVTDRVRDRQARERSEQRLEELVKKLEEEHELRERFVATLSHDLRSPLSAAKMSAQLALRTAGLPENVVDRIQKAIANIERADRLVQKLLDVSRVHAGEPLQVSFESCHLDKVVADVVGEMELQSDTRCVVDVPQSIIGNWDCEGVKRIVENLVSNGTKYGAPGRPVTIAAKEFDTRVELSVHNEGVPIHEDDQKNMFNPFSRSSSAEKSHKVGWGLGLALVQAMVQAHDGRIRVQSLPESGTTFTVSLPLNPPVQ